MRKPVCSATESLGVPALDLIDSVRDASSLNYEPETALEDKFCNIGPRAESIDAVATRIARTLEQVTFQIIYVESYWSLESFQSFANGENGRYIERIRCVFSWIFFI